KRYPAFLGKSNSRRHARVGDGDNEIRIYLRLPCQLSAELFPDLVHIPAPEDVTVGSRKIYELKDAECLSLTRQSLMGCHALFIDDHHFARFYITNIFSVY